MSSVGDTQRPAIVVGIDGSPAGASALAWAADEALARKTGLVVAHFGDVGHDGTLTEQTAAAVQKELEGFGHQLLADAVASLAETSPTLFVRTCLRDGNAARGLTDLSAGAELIVVGRSNDSHLHRFFLGSTARDAVAQAACPVVIVAEKTGDTSSDIVVGASLSEGGLAAMRFACTEARIHGSQVHAVHAWTATESAVGLLGELNYEVWLREQAATVDKWTALAREQFPGVSIRAESTGLPVFEALEEWSKHTGLLVLGTRREESTVLPRLGPIASWALSNSACPVVIVRHAGQTPTQDDVSEPRSPAL
jgi:nucleotide-binding universal stress UspA family protein